MFWKIYLEYDMSGILLDSEIILYFIAIFLITRKANAANGDRNWQ
jgi:hypothetical protein